jgi:3-oxoacyl-[acyl-carrier protein] reductase
MTIQIDLAGKKALVTGGGAGIGAEISLWLARAGATVAVHDVRREKADEVVCGIIAENGEGRAFPVIADARDDSALKEMIDEAAARLGGLDIAVNNVGNYGEFKPGRFTTLDADHFRGLMNQNFVLTAQAAATEARHMIAAGNGGVILNVTSGETTRPSPLMSAYGAAKAAINHLTQSMAVELGPEGIRVIAIAPGTTLTETVRPVFTPEHVAALVQANPLRRLTEPDELARLAVFLSSDLARCITGQFILADAGAYLSRSRPENKMA